MPEEEKNGTMSALKVCCLQSHNKCPLICFSFIFKATNRCQVCNSLNGLFIYILNTWFVLVYLCLITQSIYC